MTVPRHKVVVVIMQQDAPLAPLNKEILEAIRQQPIMPAAVEELAAAVLMEVIFIIAI